MRRRRQFAVGGALVLLLLIYFAFFSGGSGPPPTTPTTTPPRRRRGGAFPEALAAQPGLEGQREDGHPRLRRRRALRRRRRRQPGQEPLHRTGHHHSAALLGNPAAHGEPRDRGDRRHLPGAAEQAVHLRRTGLGRHGAQERHRLGGHRGQRPRHGLRPAGLVPEPDDRLAGRATRSSASATPRRRPSRPTASPSTASGSPIIAATQVIADNLVSTWTATATQPGVASAIDPTELVREVQQVRRTADTVIVYVHWGTETQACPNPQQEPLARATGQGGGRHRDRLRTPTCSWVAAISAAPTSTTAWATSPSTTTPPPRPTAAPSSSPPRAATSRASCGAPPPSSTACPSP